MVPRVSRVVPEGSESPSINYRLADLLLGEPGFRRGGAEYERTAYGYPRARDRLPQATPRSTPIASS